MLRVDAQRSFHDTDAPEAMVTVVRWAPVRSDPAARCDLPRHRAGKPQRGALPRLQDRRMFFLFVCRTVDHHDWHVHAWCALTTHYHLLITTPRGDLAAGMHRFSHAMRTGSTTSMRARTSLPKALRRAACSDRRAPPLVLSVHRLEPREGGSCDDPSSGDGARSPGCSGGRRWSCRPKSDTCSALR